jgi:hypothetical protein
MKYQFFAGSKEIINNTNISNNNLERAIIQEVESLKNNSIIQREIIQKEKQSTQISNLSLLNEEREEFKLKDNKDSIEVESNDGKSVKSQAKFQANFNVNNIAPEEKSIKVNQNNNEHETLNIKNDVNSMVESTKREKVNDVFINLNKTGTDSLLGDIVPKNPPSFFLHEPKTMRTIKNNDFEIRNSAISMERTKKSYSDGDFGRNVFKGRFEKNNEDDELASILG